MSELRKTGLIFLVAVVLYTYLALYEDHQIDDLDGPQRLTRAAAAELTEVRVELTPAEGEAQSFVLRREGPVSLERPQEGWVLELEGGPQGADPEAVRPLLQRVGTFDVQRVVDDGAGDLATYGLAEPEATIRWKAPGAEAAADREGAYRIGGRSQVGAYRFVRRDGDPRVYAADSWKVALLMKVADHYRDKRVFPPLTPPQLDALEVRLQEGEDGPEVRRLERHGVEGWEAVSPQRFPVHRPALHEMIEDLDALRAREFLGPPTPANRAEYGLDAPGVAATFETTSGDTLVVELGERDPDRTHRVRIFSSRLDAIVTVDADLLRRLSEPLEELRDRFVLRGRLDDVQRLEVRIGEVTEEFARISGPWKSMSDPTEDHTELLGAALDALGTLQARGWRDDPEDLAAYGLEEPEFEVVAHGEDGPVRILASAEGAETGPWVRVAGEPTVYRARDAAFLDKLRVLHAVVAPEGPAPAPGDEPAPPAPEGAAPAPEGDAGAAP